MLDPCKHPGMCTRAGKKKKRKESGSSLGFVCCIIEDTACVCSFKND